MQRSLLWAAALVGLLAAAAVGQDYRIEVLSESPAAEGLSPAIASQLAPQAVRILRRSRPVFDIWLCRELAVPSLQVPADVLFPLEPGQLVGLIRVHRKTMDFRGQDIEPGTYTVRFGLQPVDGAHVGTSPTRDFLLLLPLNRDTDPGKLEYKKLAEWSAEVAGTTHPCLLSLQRAAGDGPVREWEERGWWLVRLELPVVHQGAKHPLAVDLVVEGQTE
ncbi:MAG: hypothetical protein KatS3mg109_1293 [Pirellulaceae bacterium]|nr:MAG: hypothetical protein KatS3mg109_1293 [Pirellulaceae bacterium]